MVGLKEHQSGDHNTILIVEEIDGIVKVGLLIDVKIMSLDKTPNVVWFLVWHHRQLKPLKKFL